MIDVIVLGQPFWGRRIAAALASPEMKATFVGPRGYAASLVQRGRGNGVVLLRAGYRVGAPTPRGRVFDAYWGLLRRAMPRAAAAHYWLGTDVLNTVEDAASGRLRMGAVRAARDDFHVVDAPWLLPELDTVGIHGTTAHVPQPYGSPEVAPALPPLFRVLTYLPDERFAFYGGPLLMDVARRLPNVQFDVVGGVGAGVESRPPNVTWHGWVRDMAPLYAAATVVVRVPRHDGLGATVIEGLLHARHVVYTYPVPHTTTVANDSLADVVAALQALLNRHTAGTLEPNLAGRDYALETFNEGTLTTRLRTLVRSWA